MLLTPTSAPQRCVHGWEQHCTRLPHQEANTWSPDLTQCWQWEWDLVCSLFPCFNCRGSLLAAESDTLVPSDIYGVQHKRFPVFSLYYMTCGLTEENITEKMLHLHIQVFLLIRYFSKILLSKAISTHKHFGHLQLLVSEPGLRTLVVIVTSGMCDQLAASCACPDFSQVLRSWPLLFTLINGAKYIPCSVPPSTKLKNCYFVWFCLRCHYK